MRRLLLVAALAALPVAGSWASAAATLTVPADLPSAEQAQAWIEQDLAVLQARAELAAAGHAAEALAAGPHEWTAVLDLQERRVEGGARSVEWGAGLQRGWRLGDKARLDDELGAVERRVAAARLAQVRTDAARALGEGWLGLQAARETELLAMDQRRVTQEALDLTRRRLRAGDAARLDLRAAEGDLADAERQLEQARLDVVVARQRLWLRFPAADPGDAAMADPQVLALVDEAGTTDWSARLLERSARLRLAEAEQRRAELRAERSGAERRGDPTVGWRVAREGAGRERLLGLSVELPLGSPARTARHLQALREAEAARLTATGLRRQIEVEAAQDLAATRLGVTRWQQAERATQAARDVAAMTQRAYDLGEGDYGAVQTARRRAVEAARLAAEARVDVRRAQLRMLIEAHLVWGLHRP